MGREKWNFHAFTDQKPLFDVLSDGDQGAHT